MQRQIVIFNNLLLTDVSSREESVLSLRLCSLLRVKKQTKKKKKRESSQSANGMAYGVITTRLVSDDTVGVVYSVHVNGRFYHY